MIDNYLLEELVAFSKYQTLLKTAEQLNVTQPTVTRGMQKLEDDLQVQLFNRQPNKITLTKTGQLAAREAKKLLAANQEFVTRIQNFDQEQQNIKVGSTAPGPLVIAEQLAKQFKLTIDHSFVKPQNIISALEDHQYSLCFTNRELQTEQVESLMIGKEQLYVSLDQFMFLANQQQVSFKDLKGLSFVVLNDIGPWKQIIQDNIPDAKFLYQAEREALTEITRFSNFPYFTTNVTRYEPDNDLNNQDRVTIPFTDNNATMDFYVAYLKAQKSSLQPLLKQLITRWPNTHLLK